MFYKRLSPVVIFPIATLIGLFILPIPNLAQVSVAPSVGMMYFNQAESLFKSSPDSAKFYYEKALPHLEEEQNWDNYVQSLCLIYRILHQQRDYPHMETYALQAFEVASETLDPSSEMYLASLNNLATFLHLTGQYEEASDRFLLAVGLLEHQSNPNQNILAKFYHNIGFIQSKLGDYGQALKYYRKAYSLKQESSHTRPISLVVSEHAIGRTFRRLHQTDSSTIYFLQAIHRLNPDQSPSHLSKKVDILLSLSHMSLQENQPQSAQNFLDQTVQLAPQSSSKHTGKIHELQGRIFQYQENSQQALQEFQQALTFHEQRLGPAHPDVAYSFNLIAQTYQSMQQWDQALAACNQGLSLLYSENRQSYRYPFEAFPLLVVQSSVYEMLACTDSSFTQKALASLIQAKNILQTLRLTYRSEQSKLFWSEHEAHEVFQRIVKIAYHLYQQSHDNTYLQLAFQAAEEGKSFLLFEAQAKSEAQLLSGLPSDLARRERKLLQEIGFYEKTLVQAEFKANYKGPSIANIQERLFQLYRERDRWLDSLAQIYPAYVEQKYQHTSLPLHNLQESLEENQVLIEYVQGIDHWYVFAISKKSQGFHQLESAPDEISLMLSTFQAQLHEGNLDHKAFTLFSEMGHTLYASLLPAELQLPSEARLIIVPDGPLTELPFETLLTQSVIAPEEERAIIQAWRSLPYLLHDHAIQYSFSATTLFSISPKQEKSSFSKRWLGIAPAYSETLALSANISEIQQISHNLGGDILSGREATKHRFLQQADQYQMLHLAVHGVADPRHPSLSYLQFANDTEGESSRIYMHETQYMDWSAELVVLSACETGRGKWQQGAGVLSMAHAFFLAGCRSVLNTLWVVDDRISQDLSIRFYQSLLEGQTRDQALRQAKLHVLATTSPEKVHPVFWTPFILTGDATPIKNHSSSILIMLWLIGIGGLIGFLLMNRHAFHKLVK